MKIKFDPIIPIFLVSLLLMAYSPFSYLGFAILVIGIIASLATKRWYAVFLSILIAFSMMFLITSTSYSHWDVYVKVNFPGIPIPGTLPPRGGWQTSQSLVLSVPKKGELILVPPRGWSTPLRVRYKVSLDDLTILKGEKIVREFSRQVVLDEVNFPRLTGKYRLRIYVVGSFLNDTQVFKAEYDDAGIINYKGSFTAWGHLYAFGGPPYPHSLIDIGATVNAVVWLVELLGALFGIFGFIMDIYDKGFSWTQVLLVAIFVIVFGALIFATAAIWVRIFGSPA